MVEKRLSPIFQEAIIVSHSFYVHPSTIHSFLVYIRCFCSFLLHYLHFGYFDFVANISHVFKFDSHFLCIFFLCFHCIVENNGSLQLQTHFYRSYTASCYLPHALQLPQYWLWLSTSILTCLLMSEGPHAQIHPTSFHFCSSCMRVTIYSFMDFLISLINTQGLSFTFLNPFLCDTHAVQTYHACLIFSICALFQVSLECTLNYKQLFLYF